jgi:L-malate glycosyltransferase
MKIVFFSREYTTHDWRFLDSLRRNGDEVFYLRLEDSGIVYERRPIPDGVQVVQWAGGNRPASDVAAWLRLVPALEQVLKDIRPDVVHAGPVQSCGFMAALLESKPLVVMSWGSDVLFDADRDPLMRWIARFTLERCGCLVSDCQAVADKAREIIGRSLPNMVQFPWGIELNLYQPGKNRRAERARLGWQDAFIIISPRAWEEMYGIEILLNAFTQAAKVEPKLRLLMPGSGSRTAIVKNFIRSNRIEHLVHCPGRLSQTVLIDALDAADLYVSCALSDGTSISLLEAMAMRLPAVATNLPGNREWLTVGESGWLAPADASVFASAIIKAARSPRSLLDAMGKKNRSIVESRANWETNFPKLLAAYRRLKAPSAP